LRFRFVQKLSTMTTVQNYKANKILLAEAFGTYDSLPNTDVAAKENQLIRIKQIIKEMSTCLRF